MGLFVFGATVLSWPGPPHSRGFYITHNEASQSVGLLWTSDQLVAETPTCQHTTLTTDIHAHSNPQFQRASCRRPTPQTARPMGGRMLGCGWVKRLVSLFHQRNAAPCPESHCRFLYSLAQICVSLFQRKIDRFFLFTVHKHTITSHCTIHYPVQISSTNEHNITITRQALYVKRNVEARS